MLTYFVTAAAAAVKVEPDGREYINSPFVLCQSPSGDLRVIEALKDRMRRVSFVENGVAHAEIGKAGKAIAPLSNLPFAIVTRESAD